VDGSRDERIAPPRFGKLSVICWDDYPVEPRAGASQRLQVHVVVDLGECCQRAKIDRTCISRTRGGQGKLGLTWDSTASISSSGRRRSIIVYVLGLCAYFSRSTGRTVVRIYRKAARTVESHSYAQSGVGATLT
jgi:hypothetical protein